MEAHCISATPRASRAWSVRFNPKIFLAKDFLRERGAKTFNIMLAPRHPCAHYENFADFQIGNSLYAFSPDRESISFQNAFSSLLGLLDFKFLIFSITSVLFSF